MSEPAPEKRQFHIQSCLGRGGFGEVYRATMISAGGVRSDVAVKVLHKDLDPRSQSVERLRDEARLLGILNHPNILKVSDLVLLQDRVALVTEYVEGADLDQCIETQDDPIPLRPLLEALGRVAEALYAAHTTAGPDGAPLHLVHRDIKPSNIRLSKHGTVKLLDFGIAKARDEGREAKTQTNAVIGSFLYMAPERFDTDRTTPAADVYALGATLYEGITGQQLFHEVAVKRQYLMAFDQAKHDAFVQERMSVLKDTPAGVVSLLAEMLAFEHSERPAPETLITRCDDLAEELDGPSLRRWARAHAWPAPQADRGPLDGQVITETGFTLSRAVDRTSFDAPSNQTQWVGEPSPSASDSLVSAAPDPVQTAHPPAPAATAEAPPSSGSRMALVVGLLAVLVLVFTLGASVVGAALLMGEQEPQSAPAQAAETEAPAPEAAPEPAPSEDTAEPSPEPEPEPNPDAPAPQEAAPGPKPAPKPAPRPVPAPAEPAPAPTPTAPEPPAAPAPSTSLAQVSATGAPVELRQGSTVQAPGSVAPGTWEIWADFGSGFSRVREISLSSGQQTAIRCSRLRRDCWQE